MSNRNVLFLAAVLLVAGAGCSASSSSATSGGGSASASIELLNVSYDPTRELWRAINEKFISEYEKKTNVKLTINQSHGGSSSQARAVIDGLPADVVTLALWSDTDAIQKKGLIKPGWDEKFPNKSLPYLSTIVFVVRKGNPKGIKDWPDLIKPGIEIITPSPKTSGNGKLSFLAAWGSVLQRGGSEEDARKFVTELYQHAPVLDTGARGATTTFLQKGLGDVHLTWENEAHFEVKEAKGDVEIIYPSSSIQAEPPVAVVDANVDRQGTREVAEAYLNFLYTEEAQEIIAKNFYRPSNPEVLKKHSETFRSIDLFTVTKVAADWEAAQARYFAEDGIFDAIYQPTKLPKAAE